MTERTVPAGTVAETYLALLKDRGVDRLFVNAGTDFASLVEAYGRQKESQLDFPEVVVCPHENLAVSMAHGAYLGTGRVQAVMLHTSVGTANAVCGVFTARRSRIPILVTAGRTPWLEHGEPGSRTAGIHWAQEMYDQAGILRELVKWDYELRDGGQVADVLDRAIDLAVTEPRGPVYLTLPREVLARPADGAVRSGPPAVPSDPFPAPAAVAQLAEHLVTARFPVIVTATTGADPQTVRPLAELCDRYGIAVLENRPRYTNVAAGHPLHLGYQLDSVLADADVLCFLDVDVPWTPATQRPPEDTLVVQCGPEPHFPGYPIRGHRSDLSITTTVRHLLAALAPALEERRDRIDPGRRDRLAELASSARATRQAAADAASQGDGPITKVFLSWALAQVRPAGAVVVNEYWARPELLPADEPGSYYGCPSLGGLGWGLPAALGVQLTRPDRVVICTVGDGAYLFANPAACHQVMAALNLPVLTVIATNRQWGAVQSSALEMYPDGQAAATGDLSVFARLDPVPAFEKYAEASGGYGEHVTDRAGVIPALQRGLHAVSADRRPAVISVDCE